MLRLHILSVLLLAVTSTSGQQIAAPSMTKLEARNLLDLLNKRIADTTRMDALLQIAEYYILKEGKNKADADSAAAFIKQAETLQLRYPKLEGYSMLVKSRLAKEKGDSTAAKELLNNAIRLLESANDAFRLGHAWLAYLKDRDIKSPQQFAAVSGPVANVLSQLQKIKGKKQQSDYIQAVEHFFQATLYEVDLEMKLKFLNDFLTACRSIRHGPGEVWTRKEIADIYFQQGRSKEAENELLELIKFQKEGGYPHICFTYDLLAGVYVHTSSFKNALFYGLETIRSVNSRLDSSYLSHFYYRMTGIYSVIGNAEQFYQWSLKHIDYAMVSGQTQFFYDACKNVVKYLINNKSPAEALNFILDKKKNHPPVDIANEKLLALALAHCYKALKNYALAEKYCEEIVRLRGIKPDPHDVTPMSFVTDYYISTKQFVKAEHHLNLYLELFPPSGGYYRDYIRSRYMFEIDSARGRFFSAYKHVRRYQSISDSLFNATRNKQIEELTIAYETNLKEDSISLLQKTNALQQANLRQSAFVKNLTIAGIVVAFLISGLLYRQYRVKQKSNHIISHKNEQLQHLVSEKEWLLKEIHHRVKNNLQVVMSLLNSQSAFIDNHAALKAIHDSRHRVQAMSLIHQKLYNSENVSSLDISLYIRELVFYLSDSFETARRIRFELDIEPLQMDVSQAVPLGLILNEAITNSLKYAFPNDSNGTITVALIGESDCMLTISDNGIGMPAEHRKTGSLGMRLMKGLSKDLNGTFSIANDNGTTIRISFSRNTPLELSQPHPYSLERAM